MRFGELDRRMRVFETAHDHCLLPGMFMLARLDGRSFMRLTRERHPFQRPFDPHFHDHMIATAEHLMTFGFRVASAYIQSDEVSLLLHPREETFGRTLRKYFSILAGGASAAFSLRLNDIASFDCRINQLGIGDGRGGHPPTIPRANGVCW